MRVFSKRVYKFLRDHQLGNIDDVALAISAGVDSMVLFHVCLDLKSRGIIKNLSLIHINHQTRKETESEANYIKKLARKYDLKLFYFKMNKVGSSNFEKNARDFRYSCFKKVKADNIFLAHHIDDSFEWHLMQKFKSSSLVTSLGIPTKRGRFIRPLMCVTKNQIIHQAQKHQIKFFEDSTNKDISFERNFVRNCIIPAIAKKYKNYLKHYVIQYNQLAFDQGLHLKALTSDLEVIRKDDFILFFDKSLSNNFDGCYGQIEEGIKQLSQVKRGKLNSQIEKLLDAVKSHKKGPLYFSGGVKAYIYPNLIMLTLGHPVERREFLGKIKMTHLSDLLETLKDNQIKSPLYVKQGQDYKYLTKIIGKKLGQTSELNLYI